MKQPRLIVKLGCAGGCENPRVTPKVKFQCTYTDKVTGFISSISQKWGWKGSPPSQVMSKQEMERRVTSTYYL